MIYWIETIQNPCALMDRQGTEHGNEASGWSATASGLKIDNNHQFWFNIKLLIYVHVLSTSLLFSLARNSFNPLASLSPCRSLIFFILCFSPFLLIFGIFHSLNSSVQSSFMKNRFKINKILFFPSYLIRWPKLCLDQHVMAPKIYLHCDFFRIRR